MRFVVVYQIGNTQRVKWFDEEPAARGHAEKVLLEGATDVALAKEIDRPLRRIRWATET